MSNTLKVRLFIAKCRKTVCVHLSKTWFFSAKKNMMASQSFYIAAIVVDKETPDVKYSRYSSVHCKMQKNQIRVHLSCAWFFFSEKTSIVSRKILSATLKQSFLQYVKLHITFCEIRIPVPAWVFFSQSKLDVTQEIVQNKISPSYCQSVFLL